MNAKADLVTGAVFQVLLASIASVTFAPVANIIIEAADLGANVSLPVGDLIKTVAFLQVGRRSHQANLHRCMLQAATRPAPSLPVSDVAWLSRRAEFGLSISIWGKGKTATSRQSLRRHRRPQRPASL